VNCSPPDAWSSQVAVSEINFYTVRTMTEKEAQARMAKMIIDHTIPFKRAYYPDPKFKNWKTP